MKSVISKETLNADCGNDVNYDWRLFQWQRPFDISSMALAAIEVHFLELWMAILIASWE